MIIRQEQSTDIDGIYAVNCQAFESDAEARLVNHLRDANIEFISFVAEEDDQIIGHILFTPVELDSKIKLAGLGPMAVLPGWQNKGIGTQLVNEGLRACALADYDAVVVLGHPNYYPRFGFLPAASFDITSEYDVPADVFMLKELKPHALQGVAGVVRYHPAFNRV